MLLKYKPKQDHLKIVPLIPVSDAAKKVKLTRNQVQLLPGTNEVTDDEWIVMKDHLKRDLDDKIIVPIEKKVAASKRAPEGKARNLTEMPTSEAIVLVENCNSPETLTKWHREEARDEVRVHIVERMGELKMDVPKLKADSDDDEDEIGDNGNGGGDEKELGEMTVAELKAYAAEKGITVSGNKDEILAAIMEAERS